MAFDVIAWTNLVWLLIAKTNLTWSGFDCRVEQGFKYGDLFMSFKSVFQDIRNAVDYVHMQVTMNDVTLEPQQGFVAL